MAKTHREGTVQLLAVNPKYKERSAYLPAMYISSTGEYDFGFTKDDDILARGKIIKALTINIGKGQKMEPEELQIPIHHRQVLNLAKDKDYGIYCLCKVSSLVASNKRTVDKNIHLFWINDVAEEARVDLASETTIFKAKEAIFKEANTSKLRSLCIFLGGIDIRKQSHDFILSKALKQAETRPEAIMSFFNHKEDLRTFVLELYHYGIIQLKTGRYYDGEVHLGTLDEAIAFASSQKNGRIINSLGERLMKMKEGK